MISIELLIHYREHLTYTALLFITNFINARFNGYYYYSTWFYLLIITSILFHGFYPKSIVMNLIDKIPILGIVATGSYIFYTKTNVVSYPKKITFGLFIIGSFVYVLLIFFYGFLTEQFCFNPDQKIANTYHAMIHLVSSISHHAIIMM
uniref:Uncharacterized protein n=1 Tax=viral metagenome TaxID=1070528 RepID=A0A6C0B801_9ZZZZ